MQQWTTRVRAAALGIAAVVAAPASLLLPSTASATPAFTLEAVRQDAGYFHLTGVCPARTYNLALSWTNAPGSGRAALRIRTWPGAFDTKVRLLAADDTANAGQWMSYGRDYSEQRFSPLSKVNVGSVKQLGLAWFGDFDTRRGQESTPIVVDGKLYVTTAWSKVYAFDAKSGAPLWKYDPKVPGEWAVNACCDVVNRGVAAWNGKVYVATIDGRLIALDGSSGCGAHGPESSRF